MTESLKQAVSRASRLSDEQQDALAAMLLEEIASAEATDELLRIPGLLDEVAAAEREVEAGDVTSFNDVDWKA